MDEELDRKDLADPAFALDVISRGGDINGDTRLCWLCKHERMSSCPHHGMVKGICKDYSFSGISNDKIAKIIVEIITPDSNERIPKQEHLGF